MKKRREGYPSTQNITAAHWNRPKRKRNHACYEAGILEWLDKHDEMPLGKHAKGDIHRRYILIRRRHVCSSICMSGRRVWPQT